MQEQPGPPLHCSTSAPCRCGQVAAAGPWHAGSPRTPPRPGPRRAFPHRRHTEQTALGLTSDSSSASKFTAQGPWSVSLTPADRPHPSFLPGDLTGQLLDPVEKRVCCSPVQRLWTKQGHTPAGRAASGPLPEGKNNSQEQKARAQG